MMIKLKTVVDDNQFIRDLLQCFERFEIMVQRLYRSARGGRVWSGGTFTITGFRTRERQIRFASFSPVDLLFFRNRITLVSGQFLDHLHWLHVSVILNDFMDTRGINGDILSWYNFRVNNKRRVIYRVKDTFGTQVMSEIDMKGHPQFDFMDTSSAVELPYPSIHIELNDGENRTEIIPISPFVTHADILKNVRCI